MLYLVLLTLSAVVGSVRGSCTHAAIERARKCTSGLTNRGHAGNFLNIFVSEGDSNWMVVSCGNGDLLTAINCIERVMEQCKNDNSDAAHFLRSMINIESYRRVVNYFCTNVRAYTANVECIVRHHKDLNICAHEAKKNFQAQARATTNMDVLMRFQCILHHTLVGCAESVLKRNCSSNAADIVKTVLVGLQPPICAATTNSGEAGRAGTYDVLSGGDDKNDRSKLSSAGSVIFILLLVVGSLMW